MNRKDLDLDQMLDRSLEQIRDEATSQEAEQAALQRVWEQVRPEAAKHAETTQQGHIRDCSDFQALIPAYLQGALNEAKTLLIEDHVGECLPCRKALKRARAGRRKEQVTTAQQPSWVANWGWRLAGAAVIFLAVVGLSLNTSVLKVRAGGLITIEAIEGELLRVTDNGSFPVQPGEAISLARGEELRTAKGSRAMLRLADDSAVEMSERVELAVADERYFWQRKQGDAIIELERGSVIVEAADQGSGNLFVETAESRTAVTGTVFAVNHGIKGTRVSVVEGEVEVAYTGNNATLNAGQQVTTRSSLSRVPVSEEIAWSQNFDRHLRMLRDLTEISREIDAVFSPQQRYSTRLLDSVPADTVVYIGIPNLTESLRDAYIILEQKIAESESLSAWWDEEVVPEGGDEQLRELIDTVHAFGSRVGDEIVVTLQSDERGEVSTPVMLAELIQPAGFREFLESEMAQFADNGDGLDSVVIYEGANAAMTNSEADLFVWIRDDLLAVSPDVIGLQRMASGVDKAGRTADDQFRQRIRDLYDEGVEWVVGVDMEHIIDQTGTEDSELRSLGLLDMQHLIAEREEVGDRTENRVVLTFGQTRRGLASWLDEPAPMGALEFISPNATLAAAFVMRDPASLVDELFETLGSMDSGFEAELDRFEEEHGVDIRDDIAAPVGGEFAFALDGPLLPSPSWKFVMEVYDPAQLQRTLEWMVEQLNGLASDADRRGFELTSQPLGRHEAHELKSLDTGISIHYTFVDSYFVAGPSRPVLFDAMQTRSSGITLTTAGSFTQMLPRDGQVNFSGVVYQDLGSIVGPLVRLGSAATKNLTPEQAGIVEELAANAKPSLTLAYGGEDRLTFVYTHEGGFFTSGLASFFSLRTLMDVRELVGQSLPHESRREVTRPAPKPEVQRNRT